MSAPGSNMISGDPARSTGVNITFADRQPVLSVEGGVNAFSTPELTEVMNVLVHAGHRSLTLNLGDHELVSDSGQRAVVETALRLEGVGGHLTVWAPSRTCNLLAHLAGSSGLTLLERGKPGENAAPPVAAVDLAGATTSSDGGGRLTGVADSTIDIALRLLVGLATSTIGGTDGASVSFRRQGRLSTVAASDQTVLEMDAHQYATGEGPCIDASMDGKSYSVDALSAETRWPAFVPLARSLGINAIFSSALVAGDEPVGSLNIYSLFESAFTPYDRELATMFAAETSLTLTNVGLDDSESHIAARLTDALWSRGIISQAQGVLMERYALSGDGAYAALRHGSVVSGSPLRLGAAEVVASTRQPRTDASLRSIEGPHA